jgi:hypothetical protein
MLPQQFLDARAVLRECECECVCERERDIDRETESARESVYEKAREHSADIAAACFPNSSSTRTPFCSRAPNHAPFCTRVWCLGLRGWVSGLGFWFQGFGLECRLHRRHGAEVLRVNFSCPPGLKVVLQSDGSNDEGLPPLCRDPRLCFVRTQ